MSEAWTPITMREVRIVTAAAAGGIRVRGVECAYLVQDATGEAADIAVPTADGLRELISALRPARITFRCTVAERRWWIPAG